MNLLTNLILPTLHSMRPPFIVAALCHVPVRSISRCRSLILDTCTKPSAVAPSSRVTVTKAPKGAVRATTPLNHS